MKRISLKRFLEKEIPIGSYVKIYNYVEDLFIIFKLLEYKFAYNTNALAMVRAKWIDTNVKSGKPFIGCIDVIRIAYKPIGGCSDRIYLMSEDEVMVERI